jgi:single-strand DNA-binding protein
MVNKIILLGNVGSDPEVKNVGESKVSNFTFATSESWKDKQGNKQTETQWHNIEAWGNLADICERYIKKGSKLYLEGMVKYKNYEKDGQKKYFTIVIANSIKMLGSKEQSGEVEPESDDLPY